MSCNFGSPLLRTIITQEVRVSQFYMVSQKTNILFLAKMKHSTRCQGYVHSDVLGSFLQFCILNVLYYYSFVFLMFFKYLGCCLKFEIMVQNLESSSSYNACVLKLYLTAFFGIDNGYLQVSKSMQRA